MGAWRQNTSVVSKLRINGGGSDALATRLQFERLFGANDFLPGSLPPKAIVCIRHLRDPAPRSLRLNRFDAARTNAWRNSVAREIERLYARAFRPIRESIPAQAESVVFADKTELLACLASDWCDGFLSERWWWRGLFPDLYVAKIWLEAAEFAPAALQLLARRKKAAKFVARLQPQEAAELLRRIIRVFNLDKLEAALFAPPEKETPGNLPDEKLTAKQFRQAEDHFAAILSSAPLAPDAEIETLSFERQALLAVGLTLARSPSVARSAEFAREVKIFRAGFETRKIGTGKISTRATAPEQRKKKTDSLREETISAKAPAEMREFFEDFAGETKKPSKPVVSSEKPKRKSSPKIHRDLEKIIFATEPKTKIEPSQREKTPGPPRSEIKFERPRRKKEFEDRRSEKESKPREKETKPDRFEKAIEAFAETEEEAGVFVQTNYGGVFYLLNLALYLKLYRDFTEAGDPEIDLNIWDFVALLGRDIVGRKIEKDPVWKLLADLAGRENDRKLPPAENWLKELFEDARARLFRALNRRTRKELSALLLARKASVHVTATHLEVEFHLADVAFEVRLTGLDRDPGWIPAAGKFVYFHFV